MEDCRETRHPPVIPRMKGPPWKDLHSGRWPCWPHFVSACPKAARPRSVHWWCQYCRSPSHPSPRRAIVAGLCVLGCVWGLGLPQICQLGDFAHRGDRDCDRNRHRLGHGAYRVGQFCARADRRDRLYVFIVFLAKKPCQHTSNISWAHRRLILDNHRRLYRFCQPRRRAAMAGLGAAPETTQNGICRHVDFCLCHDERAEDRALLRLGPIAGRQPARHAHLIYSRSDCGPRRLQTDPHLPERVFYAIVTWTLLFVSIKLIWDGLGL